MLPIEEGCLAVTCNCRLLENNGVCVVVGKFVGKVEGWRGDNQWETDTLFKGFTTGRSDNHVKETCLLRIDGGEFEKESEEESVFIN